MFYIFFERKYNNHLYIILGLEVFGPRGEAHMGSRPGYPGPMRPIHHPGGGHVPQPQFSPGKGGIVGMPPSLPPGGAPLPTSPYPQRHPQFMDPRHPVSK